MTPQSKNNSAAQPVRRKRNPLKVILPITVTLAAGAAAFLFVWNSFKDVPTINDMRKALEKEDYKTAYALSEQLPDEECEKVLERYIISVLNDGTNDADDAADMISELFDEGFDSYKSVYKSYNDGSYTPTTETTENNEIPAFLLVDTSEALVPVPETEEQATSEAPTEEIEVPEMPFVLQVMGHWKRELQKNCYEHIVFNNDGTGYIYSDIVSEKRSKTDPRYFYYDGKIKFTWSVVDDEVFIDATIDPYCFVAYRGHAAEGHYSSATWKGSANGSHDYYFGYETQSDYLCDMIGISSMSDLYRHDCITKAYWQQLISVADNAWDMYFNHYSQLDFDSYEIDYSTLEDKYYDSPELRAKYEDVDLYHFVPFTEMILTASGNKTTVSLDFEMEDYERVD